MDRTITVFEGPDGAGKSTVAKAFAYESTVIHHHGPYHGERDIARKYFDSMFPAYAGLRSMILDRSWLSEPIYGAAFREGENRIRIGQRRILERLALSRRGVVVLCLPKRETVLNNWAIKNGQGLEYLTKEMAVDHVYDLYKDLRTELPIVVYDYQDTITDGLKNRVEAARGARPEGPGAGRWRIGSQILLVGDRPNATTTGPHVPLGGLSSTGCSVWLAERLEEAKIPETALYWVNAFTAGGRSESSAFIRRLQPRAVIAMGTEAAQWCHHHDVKYDVEPHPQFWKRFHHHKPYSLIERLKELIHGWL